jgi:alkaline phosphatase
MSRKHFFYKLSFGLTALLFLCSATLFSCAEKTLTFRKEEFSCIQPAEDIKTCPSLEGEREVKNIILLIGDGMGLGQVMLTRSTSVGIDGRLNMETFPVVGLMRTHSANSLVTDSAASATAMACGIKTNNGMVGTDPEGEDFLSILEAVKERKMETGLVATSSITHATPACFGAHVKSRDDETKIAEQLLANKINVLFGGGRIFFLPRESGGKRKDGRNLIQEAVKESYSYITTKEELAEIKGPYVLGLFQDEELTTSEPEPTLASLSKKAIEILNKSENGFFLMVEGSQIDWACHDNDKKNMIKQTVAFDQAVKVAKEFAERDSQTIIIVTGDHETGGLIVLSDEEGFKIKNKWTTREHSAMPLPAYAFGPGAIHFTGVYDNTDLAKKMAKLLGIKEFPRKLNKDGRN